ncbi:hypothetical protein [Thomasclavelia cocleata]|jgi:hypothetical protein|nr:hypothetical protein [Thomasclavelia cocleata]
MKEIYEIPSIEVTKFENSDSVIMMSNVDTDIDNEGGDPGWDD